MHAAVLCGIGIMQFLWAPGISMLFPSMLITMSASWFIGKKWGFGMALVAALAELASPLFAGTPPAGVFGPVWNFIATLFANILIAHLAEYTRRHREAERDLIRKDYLTGIDNIRSFYDEGSMELERCRRNRTPITIVYMDIDDLESLNDTLGHRVGDRALQSIAAAIKDAVRITDIVARIGGDEFAVLLPGGDFSQSSTVITRLQETVMSLLTAKRWPISVTTAGITYLSIPDSIDHLLKGAEESMDIAKQSSDTPVRHTVVTKLQLIVGEENQKKGS